LHWSNCSSSSQKFSQQSFIIAPIGRRITVIIYLALREILTKRHERKKYRFPVVAEGYLTLLRAKCWSNPRSRPSSPGLADKEGLMIREAEP
jgi:hypothetical protein